MPPSLGYRRGRTAWQPMKSGRHLLSSTLHLLSAIDSGTNIGATMRPFFKRCATPRPQSS